MTHRPIHEELSAQISELSIEDDSSQLIHPEDTGQSERAKHARDAMVLQFFTAFIDFFDSVEAHARDKFTVIGWRDSLSQSAHALYPTEGFRTLVALFIQMEPICGNAAFHFPRKILADASRDEPWRIFYGTTGLLDFFLDLFNKYREQGSWNKDLVRMMANTCCSSDENRARVVAKFDFSILVEALYHEQNAPYAVVALYNIAGDYEPAENALRTLKLFAHLVAMLDYEGHPFNFDLLGHVCLLLDFAILDFNVEDLPENAVEVIYTKMRSQKLTLDEETTMSNAIFALLEHERYRKLAIERDFVPLLMTLMADTYYMDFEETPVDQTTGLEIPSLELRELMGQIRSNLSKRLWDISDLPEFTGKYPPNGKLVDTFCTWLSKPKAEMQICACSVLRNVAHSEQTSMLFLADAVMESRMKSLLGLLRGQTNFQVALEGLRLLKNLAFPETNKFALTHGQATLELVMSLCSRIKNLSIRCAAVATVRTLLTGSFTNVKKFLWKGNSWAPTYYFPRLLTLNWEHEDLSFRMEVAQLIGQIWRVAHKENGLVETKITDEAIRQAQGAYRNVAEPICALITDSKNPSLVTQGWLGLYLMAISKRGADEIYDFIHKSPTDQLFGDTIAALEAGSKDQDNAISLRITLMPHYIRSEQHDRIQVLQQMFDRMQRSFA